MFVYLNDRLVGEENALISVFDHGFLYGDGIYETMRSYEGVIYKLEEHLERLELSASLISLDLPLKKEELVARLYETLEANALKNATLRLTVSRGPGEPGLNPALCPHPTLVITNRAFSDYPRAFYEHGVRLLVARTRRNLPEALDPRIKSLNFLNNIQAKIEAVKAEFFEAVMLNAEGHLTEGTVSNLFFIKDGALCTPSPECGLLEGITRATILEIAAKEGYEINQGRFGKEELYEAEEVFLSNTTMELMPVCRIDHVCLPPGEITERLRRVYREEVQTYVDERKPGGLRP